MRDLTRRDLIRAASVAAAAVAVGSVQGLAPSAFGAPPAEWTHDPASPIGPPDWGDIAFPTCGMGRSQSPVNISTDTAVDMHGSPLMLRYQTSELAVENTGHVIEVPIPAGVRDTLQIGGDFYTLSQYHFHAPSEHTVDGRQADVEAHFVHSNTKGATAVVGVFFRVGTHPNDVLDRILLSAPATEGEEVHAGEANPAELFHGTKSIAWTSWGGMVRVSTYYAYTGSLTTPACTEGVRWSVLADGGQVSTAAVAHLHQVIGQFPNYNGYPNNNRPVQPLNGRIVKVRAAAGPA